MCSGTLSFMDLDTEDTITLGGIVKDNIITFTTEQLNTNRHYSVAILARNIAGSSRSTEMISKHISC